MIGVLALQGAFLEHVVKFKDIGVNAMEVRTPEELSRCDALVIPGGESTSITLIAQRNGMWDSLVAWVKAKQPTWGTCAGMIMLSEEIEGKKEGGQPVLGGMEILSHRNFFGRQLSSFEAEIELSPSMQNELAAISSHNPSFRTRNDTLGIFIRAPAILRVNEGAEAIAWVHAAPENSSTKEKIIVGAKNPFFLVTAFHPELSRSVLWHEYFVAIIVKANISPEKYQALRRGSKIHRLTKFSDIVLPSYTEGV
jgi:pyridoxal 5'-phosphate synthase pdxT subunit